MGTTGITGASILTALKACTEIHFSITDPTGLVTPVNITTLDFSAATDYETVRADLQTALRANANPQLANATVQYTAASGQFSIVGSVTGTGNRMAVVAGSNPSTDFSAQAGLLIAGGGKAIPGVSAQTPLQAVQDSANLSDNFGSFGFIDSTANPPTPLQASDVAAVSAWNAAQNVKYIYCTPSTVAAAPTA